MDVLHLCVYIFFFFMSGCFGTGPPVYFGIFNNIQQCLGLGLAFKKLGCPGAESVWGTLKNQQTNDFGISSLGVRSSPNAVPATSPLKTTQEKIESNTPQKKRSRKKK